jgi:hypothetical protein
MKPDGFRRIALALANAVEGSHMGHPDFRVNGRIFASLHTGDRYGMVKLTPDQQLASVAARPDIFAPETGAWGRSGCTRVDLASADDEAVGEALTLARQNVVRKTSSRPTRSRRAAD